MKIFVENQSGAVKYSCIILVFSAYESGNLCFKQGCESSDFNLISDFFALHKTPFSDF